VNVELFGSDNQFERSDDKQMTKNKRQSHFVVGTKQSIIVVQDEDYPVNRRFGRFVEPIGFSG
jgi:hypothetical protein